MTNHHFHVHGLQEYDVPVFEEKQGRDWVQYGQNDQYAKYLETLYMNSSIHGAIVNGTAAMIYGQGLDSPHRDLSDGTREQWVRLQAMLQESDPELLLRAAIDLKLYGQCYINGIWNRARTRVSKMRHLPVHTMRSGVADSTGKVDWYYYSPDWSNKRLKPDMLPAFCNDDRTLPSFVLHVRRYAPSFHYYGVPDYAGSCGYIELDYEVQRFHLNNVKNGLFPSLHIAMKNGEPTDEEADDFESMLNQKFAGSTNAGRLLITWSDGAEQVPEITPVNTNGSDTLYEYLSRETVQKVLTGHRVTSPLLFGIRGEGTGWGNNADELRDAYDLYYHSVVKPFQHLLLDGLAPVFSANGITIPVEFVPLQPASYMAANPPAQAPETRTTPAAMAAEESASVDLAAWLAERGEQVDEDEWELLDAREVDYEQEAALDALWAFAAVPPAEKARSGQDNPLILVRYQYAPLATGTGATGESRDFCVKMVEAAKVYTREDIVAAGRMAVNPGFGYRGAAKYDIWKFKGGPRCHHFWVRKTYLRKGQEEISVSRAKRLINTIPASERDRYRLPVNEPEVARRPVDMPNKGFHPNNKNLPRDAR